MKMLNISCTVPKEKLIHLLLYGESPRELRNNIDYNLFKQKTGHL